jgi:hypothetical protein
LTVGRVCPKMDRVGERGRPFCAVSVRVHWVWEDSRMRANDPLIEPDTGRSVSRVPHWFLPSRGRPFSIFVLAVVLAIVSSLAILLCRHFLKAPNDEIVWLPYNSATLAHCREAGIPVVVVYAVPLSTSEYVWTLVPFHDRELAKRLNAMGIVAMDTAFRHRRPEEDEAIRREMDKLGLELPIIVVYDSQRGDLVIPARKESRIEREKRVCKLLWDYLGRRNE